MSKTQAIQDFLRLHRRITAKALIPMLLARNHLEAALSQEIILSGLFQYTRRYKGYLSHNKLRLRGPITRTGRQLCFLVDGALEERGSETVLEGRMYLTDGNFYQTAGAAVTILIIFSLMMHWGAVVVTPVFFVFIYGMTQWHFQHYAHEITQLLTKVMMEGKLPA